MTRRVVIMSPFWDWEGFLNCPGLRSRARSFLYRLSVRQMGLGPVRGAGAGTRIRSQLHLKPREGKKRRRDRKREPMSSNCQMVNIFAPFQRRINCRAARGLRRTDQCGRGSWPWLSPLRLPPLERQWAVREGESGGGERGGEVRGFATVYSPNHLPIKPPGPRHF